MIVIAGPPGGGKSTIFPISQFGVDHFNADDRAAELNRGSYHKISEEIRTRVNLEFQRWVIDRIEARKSFAIETTLRSPITFEQARLARAQGFWTTMRYVSAGSVEESVKRVVQRSYRGGHSASDRLIRDIYQKSTKHLLTALDFGESSIELLRIYDNSHFGGPAKELMTLRRSRPIRLTEEIPRWLDHVLKGTKFDLATLRQALESGRDQSTPR